MSETGAIAQISRARQFLAQAKDLTDIKAVRDMAEAARQYARARDLGLHAMNEAAEIKLEAERKGGQVLAEMKKHPGGQPSKNHSSETSGSPQKIEDLGITHDQSSQWQAMAAVSEPDFKAIVEETKAAEKPLTTKAVVREGRKRQRAATAARRNSPRKHEPEQVVNVQRIEDAHLAADFTKWLAYTTRISALSPERVFECLTLAEVERVTDSLDHFVRWAESFRAVREAGPRLQAVGGNS